MFDPQRKTPLQTWFAFWVENAKQSYKTATDHGNLASFVGAILTAVCGALGMSALTTSRVWTALGAGIGLVLWFLVIVLVWTPSRMWGQPRGGQIDGFGQTTVDLAFAALKARDEELSSRNAQLEQQVELLINERPRTITSDQSRQIADQLRAWPAYANMAHCRRILVVASPQSQDARSYAGQIRMAFDKGSLWSDEVLEFTWGDETYVGEHTDANQGFLAAHEANVTIWGSDTAEHDGEPLDQAVLKALRAAGVDTVHQPGPTSIGGQVAVIVGRGAVTEAARQRGVIARLTAEIETLKLRR